MKHCFLQYVSFLGLFAAQLPGLYAQTSPDVLPVEQLTTEIKRSLVVVEGTSRSGAPFGTGSGFAIADDLIATARHVIGEGRAISVVVPDGSRVEVLAVHSQMAHLDMAILRTTPHGLPPLSFSPRPATEGQPVVALGHPHGLNNSVVSGVVSAKREIDGISMLQLAMAIEPGNSGGPVVDRTGTVLGMVTLKSTESDNIGFAIPISHLSQLQKSPNPVPIDRWVTIGKLDSHRWEVIGGANWTQRAGRIQVSGSGSGFGGRTLCIRQTTDDLPVEVEVDVRIEDESGAAGLVLHSDGGDRHFGFYPSAGMIRVTRFDGPDVRSWTILHNAPHDAWRSGQWNTLKVRIDATSLQCRLNGSQVAEIDSIGLPIGRTGLAAFRGTQAEFRRFTVAPRIPSRRPTPEQRQQVASILALPDDFAPLPTNAQEMLLPLDSDVSSILETEAAKLRSRAALLQRLSADVRLARILNELSGLLNSSSEQTPSSGLLRAALLVAKLDNSEVEPGVYLQRVDEMAQEIRELITDDADESQRIQALDQWLFELNGFRGSEQQYYVKSNSYLNEVIDDREGLPISLSILYIELAQRLKLNVQGIGLPGHFIVQFTPASGDNGPEWIDVFQRAARLTDDDIQSRLIAQGFDNSGEFTEPQTTGQIIQRMLRNLLALAERDRDDDRVLRYLETLVTVAGDRPEWRAKRLEMRARTGRAAMALEDADWFLENRPPGMNVQQLQRLRLRLKKQAAAESL